MKIEKRSAPMGGYACSSLLCSQLARPLSNQTGSSTTNILQCTLLQERNFQISPWGRRY